MRSLCKKQLAALRSLGPNLVCIIGGNEHRSLLKRGLLEALGSDGDSFFAITTNGLRALADALDAGTLPKGTIENFRSRSNSPTPTEVNP